jgi:opacity protein-like surface antigen
MRRLAKIAVALTLSLSGTLLLAPISARAQSDASALSSSGGYFQGLSSGRYTAPRQGENLGTGSLSLRPSLGSVEAAASLGGLQAATESQPWQPMQSFRLELEYTRRDHVGFSMLRPHPATTAAAAPYHGSFSLMANAMVDLKVADWLTPYIGFGVGLANNGLERFSYAGAPFSGEASQGLSYQGIVGLTVPFGDHFAFYADGRYLQNGELGQGLAEPALNGQSWTAAAGIRFRFGK